MAAHALCGWVAGCSQGCESLSLKCSGVMVSLFSLALQTQLRMPAERHEQPWPRRGQPAGWRL